MTFHSDHPSIFPARKAVDCAHAPLSASQRSREGIAGYDKAEKRRTGRN